jgi:hypothetical protein
MLFPPFREHFKSRSWCYLAKEEEKRRKKYTARKSIQKIIASGPMVHSRERRKHKREKEKKEGKKLGWPKKKEEEEEGKKGKGGIGPTEGNKTAI